MTASLVTALLIVSVIALVAGVQFVLALCRPPPRRSAPGPAVRTAAGGQMDRIAYLRLQALHAPDPRPRRAPQRRRGSAG